MKNYSDFCWKIKINKISRPLQSYACKQCFSGLCFTKSWSVAIFVAPVRTLEWNLTTKPDLILKSKTIRQENLQR